MLAVTINPMQNPTQERQTALLDSAAIGSRTFAATLMQNNTRNWTAEREKQGQAWHSNFANEVLLA